VTTTMRPRATLDRIAIPPGSRYLIVGQTGSGKSTLAGVLLTDWVRKGRRLVMFDAKPRWKAEFLPNGMPASRRYRGWTLGEPFLNYISVCEFHAAVAVDVWRTANIMHTPTLFYSNKTMPQAQEWIWAQV